MPGSLPRRPADDRQRNLLAACQENIKVRANITNPNPRFTSCAPTDLAKPAQSFHLYRIQKLELLLSPLLCDRWH
jgi:hypothetical protein